MMTKKVMLVLNEAPLPYAGAASRWYFILCKELQRRNFHLDIFASCSKAEQLKSVKEIFPKANVFTYGMQPSILKKLNTLLRPFSYTISKEMQRAIQDRFFDDYDIVHVEQIFATWALPLVDKRCMISVHYLASIDLKNTKTKTMKDYIILPLLKITEKRLLSRYKHIKACSLNIEDKIKKWYPAKNYVHFPFALDIDNYEFLKKEHRKLTKTITLIASMNWYPGKSAALNLINEVWPTLKRLNPEIKLRIVGWEARSVLKDFLHFQDIEILENVPDIKKYFYNADLLVYIPDQGSGIKIKIQESMLLGTPVVTNECGVEGLDLVDKYDVLIAKNNEQAISQIHYLFNNPNEQERIRINARNSIEMKCNGKIVVDQLIQFYEQMGRK